MATCDDEMIRIAPRYDITVTCSCGRVRTVNVPAANRAEWVAHYSVPTPCHH